MRLNNILLPESAKDDLYALSIFAEKLLDELPNVIKKDQTIIIHKAFADYQIKKITSELDEKYKEFINYINDHIEFNFLNSFMGSGKLAGAYSPINRKDGLIYICIANFMESNEEKTKKEILSYYVPDKHIHTLKTVLIHEMRHALQYLNYPGYFIKSKNVTYETDPIELDAAWIHHLNDRNPENYNDIKEFVKNVMDSFAHYKQLTAKQYEHYKRKTAKYFVDYKTIVKKQKSLEERKLEYLKSIIEPIKKKLIEYSNDDRLGDLKELGSKDEKFFIFPTNSFRKTLKKILDMDRQDIEKEKLNFEVSMMYLFLAMIYKIHKFNTKRVELFLSKVYHITSKDALEFIEHKGTGKFDKDFFIQLIKKAF